MDCDADLPIVNHPTDNEIIEMVTDTNVDVEDSDDEKWWVIISAPKIVDAGGTKIDERLYHFYGDK